MHRNMTQHLLLGLIPEARLKSYSQEGDKFEQAFARYQWNVQLAEAMLPSLNYLEVGLRNRLNVVLVRYYGANWLVERSPLLLSAEQNRILDDMCDRHIREKHRLPVHDDYVAQMSFGFWSAYFHKRFDPVIWHKKNALEIIFPEMILAQRTRKLIQPQLLMVKDLRNRIAHHEPVWNARPNIMDIHRICHDLIAAMSPEAAELLRQIDRLPQVWKGQKI